MARISSNIHVAVAVLVLLLSSCKGERAPHIEGDISNLPDGGVYLRAWDGLMRTLDSTASISGHFSFEVPAILPDMLYIQFQGYPSYYLPVIVDGNDVDIAGNFNYTDDIVVSGSQANEALGRLRRSLTSVNIAQEVVNFGLRAYADSVSIKDSLTYNILLTKRDSIASVISDQKAAFVRENPTSIVSVMLILDAISEQTTAVQIDSMLGILDDGIPDNAFIRRIQKKRSETGI